MTEAPREITKAEFEATFSPPMLDVTESAEEIVDLWAYADSVIQEKYHSCTAWEWQVKFIYESRDGSYQHINIPVPKDDTYLDVIVDKPNRKIIGHYILDLGVLGQGFTCSTCGEWHNELPMSFGALSPYWYDVIAPEERERRALLSSDQCIIDEEHYFVRGSLEIPVIDGSESFSWGVWVSLSRKNFERMSELWESSGRENEPPYFGWLSTALPGYPDTLNLKTHVHTRPVGLRPFIELEPTEHPLAVEQQNGITMARVKEIVEGISHDNTDENLIFKRIEEEQRQLCAEFDCELAPVPLSSKLGFALDTKDRLPMNGHRHPPKVTQTVGTYGEAKSSHRRMTLSHRFTRNI